MKTWKEIINSIPGHRLLNDGAELVLEYNEHTKKYNIICQSSYNDEFYWCKEYETLKEAKEEFYNAK